MNASHTSAVSQNHVRDRYLLITSLCLLSIAGVISLLPLALQKISLYQSKMRGPQWVSKASTEQINDSRKRTNELRELWKPWALAHQGELRRMLTSKGGDENSLMAVYQSLPLPPRKVNANYEGALFGPKDIFSGTVQYFSRSTADRDTGRQMKGADERLLQRYKKAAEKARIHREKNYKLFSDVAVITTMNNGPIQHTLWASGRVTETILPLPYKDDQYLEAEEKEVTPPTSSCGKGSV